MIGLPSSLAIPKFAFGDKLNKYVKLAAPASAIGVCAIVLMFVVWPTVDKLIKLNISNRNLSERALKLDQKAKDLVSLDRDLLDKQLGAGEMMLPSDKGVFIMVQQLEKVASSSGVILNKVDVTPGTVGDNMTLGQSGTAQGTAGAPVVAPGQGAADLGELAVSTPKVQLKVSLTSDYSAFLQFLSALSALPRVVSVHDLTLASSSVGSSAALRSVLTLDAYWSPLPKELPDVETPINKLSSNEEKLLNDVSFQSASFGGSEISAPAGPQVPIGRSDIFAPF